MAILFRLFRQIYLGTIILVIIVSQRGRFLNENTVPAEQGNGSEPDLSTLSPKSEAELKDSIQAAWSNGCRARPFEDLIRQQKLLALEIAALHPR